MKFFFKTKGVISIFLIIVMLPLFTSAVVLVDGTRYQSAKTMIQEAGDLAAYSTIANYNVDLKDNFGLFAMNNQNIPEEFNKYFKSSLGESASSAESYSDKVHSLMTRGLFRTGKYTDANFVDLYNFIINQSETKAEGIYPLSNPAVLQNQIVEYTKYRALETLLERFEILGKFSQARQSLQQANKEMEAVEKLAKLDENVSAPVASGIGELQGKLAAYNEQIDNLRNYAGHYEEYFQKELEQMAIKGDDLSAKYNRVTYFEKINNVLDNSSTGLNALYNSIKSQCSVIKTKAQDAIEEYKSLKREYSEYPEIVEDIDEEITKLERIIGNDPYFSVVVLSNNLTDPSAVYNDFRPQVNDANDRILETYRKYDREYRETQESLNSSDMTEDEKETFLYEHVLFRFSCIGGLIWEPAESGRYLYESVDDDLSESARMLVETFYIKDRIKEVNSSAGDIFKQPAFFNIYQAEADEKKDSSLTKDENGETPKAKDTASEANSRKTPDNNSSSVENNEIDPEVYKNLPSQKANDTPRTESQIADIGEQSASSMLSSSRSASNSFQSFFESGRNDVLTYCYILDTFKTANSLKDFSDKTKSGWYATTWRYLNENGEVNFRDKPKKELTTFFGTHEVEYIFGGNRKESTNSTIVYAWIYGTRLANNVLAVYNNSAAKAQCLALAAAASAATFGAVPISVFKWLFIAAWAAGETALEMSLMLDDGYRVPLIKTSNMLYIGNFFDIAKLLVDRESVIPRSTSSIVNVCYEDYLMILLFFVGRETRLRRVADLVHLNMRAMGHDEFDIFKEYTFIKADTSVTIKYLFQPVSQFRKAYEAGNLGVGLKLKNTIYQGY